MKNLLLILFLGSFNHAHLQLQTYLVNPVNSFEWGEFLGSDYQILNAQFTGSDFSSGTFNASMTNIGLNSGIILTTGRVLNDTVGPIGPNNFSNVGYDNATSGYSLLDQISGATSYNAAVIEFDFIPSVDSIEIKYVFGSEEYPEFAPPNNTQFNDVFGIFISGPGIVGVQNIALLPNGQAVGIGTVNPINNSQFYINNGDGYTFPYNQQPQYIQYDGFTSVMTAKTDLQSGESYHMIIAIADIGDGIYDSGIFLQSCAPCSFYAGLEGIQKTNTIYPNPADKELFIGGINDSDEVFVFNAIGMLIGAFENTSSIDVSNFENGVYWIQFENKGNSTRTKFMVQH